MARDDDRSSEEGRLVVGDAVVDHGDGQISGGVGEGERGTHVPRVPERRGRAPATEGVAGQTGHEPQPVLAVATEDLVEALGTVGGGELAQRLRRRQEGMVGAAELGGQQGVEVRQITGGRVAPVGRVDLGAHALSPLQHEGERLMPAEVEVHPQHAAGHRRTRPASCRSTCRAGHTGAARGHEGAPPAPDR